MMIIKTKKRKFLGIYTVLTTLVIITAVLGVYDFIIPDNISVYTEDVLPTFNTVTIDETDSTAVSALGGSIVKTTATAKLFGVLPLKTIDVNRFADIRLYPGGIPFGVRLSTAGVLVVGFESVKTASGEANPAESAGLRVKDVITHADGKAVNSSLELSSVIEGCSGKEIEIKFTRAGSEQSVKLTPALCKDENKYKTGVWVRDSTAGIGTVTFVVPETGEFGGLGHGICDVDTGELMPMRHGAVVDVSISGVNRGEPGDPGEIKGFLGAIEAGDLTDNTNCGVFGIYSSVPKELKEEEPIPIALSSEVKEGDAYILCTLENGVRKKYNICIKSINHATVNTKNFVIEATDPALIEKSGGIVQGMSGSPIIQDGKLIGAVTHVLISDPTKGYGIFIENMLAAAE